LSCSEQTDCDRECAYPSASIEDCIALAKKNLEACVLFYLAAVAKIPALTLSFWGCARIGECVDEQPRNSDSLFVVLASARKEVQEYRKVVDDLRRVRVICGPIK